MALTLRKLVPRAGEVLIRSVLPACLFAVALYAVIRGDAIDFDANLWEPANAVAAGDSPYPEPYLAELIKPFFLYPPLVLAIAIPFSMLPHDLARALFFALEIAAVAGALRLVGVRDIRVLVWGVVCYPVFDALLLGNPTLLLLPALAAAWRWRQQWWVVGLVVGVAGAFKLLVWPLGIWLLATRRWKSAALAAACASLGVIVPWAFLGFAGIEDYRTVAQLYTEHNGGPRAISISNFAQEAGLSSVAADVAQWACGLAVLAAAVMFGRRDGRSGDWQAFTLAVVGALILSPVVWIHYLALLLIPLAIVRRSFDVAWLVVCALWIFPLLPHGDPYTIAVGGRVLTAAGPAPTIFQLAVGLGFIGYVVVVTCRRSGAFVAN